MARILTSCGLVGLLVVGCAASAQSRRPKVDVAAMQDAIKASRASGENGASSASYAHFLESRMRMQEGEHQRALDELRLALVTDAGNPFLRVSLAEEYARVGDYVRAERTLRQTIETSPDYEPAQLLMGRVLGEQKKNVRARVHLRRAIRLVPTDTEAWLALAEIELQTGHPDEAISVVEGMVRAVPDDSRGLRLLGNVFADQGDLARSERMLRRAVEVFPGDFEAWTRLAQLEERQDHPEKAEAAYAEALQRDPDNLELLLAAGRVSLEIGADDRARAWFERILSLTDQPEMAVRIAFAWVGAEHYRQAAEVLDHARARSREEQPHLAFYSALMHEKLREYLVAAEAYAEVPAGSELFAEARVRRASALSLAGQHPRALDAFRKELASKPDYLAAYPPYARALERSGNPKEAERTLRAAVKKWPTPELYDALAQNLRRQGKSAAAVKLLEKAQAARPEDDALRFLLGAAYEREGRVDDALEQMRLVLRKSPDNPAVLNFIGYTLADHGRDYEEAERLVKRALELKPDAGAFLDSLGWIYFRRGEVKKAVEVLERAAQLEGSEPLILEHLGDAYREADRKPEAARSYQRALEQLRGQDDPLEAASLRRGLERKLKNLSRESAGR